MFTFNTALELVKAGYTMRRSGWNGKGMYIELQTPDAHSKMTKPYLFLYTAKGDNIPWVASHEDLMAEDWEFAE